MVDEVSIMWKHDLRDLFKCTRSILFEIMSQKEALRNTITSFIIDNNSCVDIPYARHAAVLADSRHAAVLADSRHAAVLAVSRHAAVLADSRHAAVLADSRHAAVLADYRHVAVLADSRHAAVLMDSSHAVVLMDSSHEAVLMDSSHAAVLADSRHAAVLADSRHAAALAKNVLNLASAGIRCLATVGSREILHAIPRDFHPEMIVGVIREHTVSQR